MKRVFTLALAIFVLMFFTSCSLITEIVRGNVARTNYDSEGVQTIQSTESSLVLEFPKSWTKNKLHEEASIQLCFIPEERYLIVIEESGNDFADDFTLDDFVSIVLKNMQLAVDNAEVSAIKDTMIGSGTNAKQFEISCEVDKLKVKYFVTCAVNDEIYYQFVAWSTQSKYDEAKPVYEDILASASF